MDFKNLLNDDLKELFFNKEEFATEVHLSTLEEPIIGIFDEKTEVIFDSASEYGDVSAFEPSVLLKVSDAELIDFETEITIEGTLYKLREKDKEDVDLVRIYLEKRRN